MTGKQGPKEWWNEGAAALLRETMFAKGLEAPALARLIGDSGVTDRSVRNWMGTAGSPKPPKLENLHGLCTALGVTREQFRAAAYQYEERQRAAELAENTGPAITPENSTVAPPRYRRAILGGVVLSVLVLVGSAVFFGVTGRSVETFTIPPEIPDLYDRAAGGQVSPDGTKVAFLARSAQTRGWTLYVYSLTDRTTRALPESEGNYTSFFWDADGRSIFFITAVNLMRVSIAGGKPEPVGHAAEALRGAVSRNGVVILGSRYGLIRIDETGNPELLTRVAEPELAHSLPFFLPDQTRVLFTITKRNPDDTIGRTLAVLSLGDRSVRALFPTPTGVEYVRGHLLYVRERTLIARPFDQHKLEFTGPPRPIAGPVWSDRSTGEAGFSSSENTLVVRPPPRFPSAYRATAGGGIVAVISEPADIRHIAVGRVTNQIALVGRGPAADDVSLWLYSPAMRAPMRLARAHNEASSPLFSHDERLLYYAAAGTSWASIHAIDLGAADNTPRLVFGTKDIVAPRDVSPDGRFLLFQRWAMRDGNLWYMPVGDPEAAQPLIATPEDEGESARFSPDGRQVAFVAKRGKDYAVYVTDFPPAGAPRRAMEGDGWRGRWSADGRKIYFARKNGIYEADPRTRQTRLLFTMSGEISLMEPASDGGFFLRETSVVPTPTIATRWWDRVVEHPLDLSAAR